MRKTELCLEIKAETLKAYLFSDGVFTEWVPKSQIELFVELDQEGSVGETVIVIMPEWLAEDKGFI